MTYGNASKKKQSHIIRNIAILIVIAASFLYFFSMYRSVPKYYLAKRQSALQEATINSSNEIYNESDAIKIIKISQCYLLLDHLHHNIASESDLRNILSILKLYKNLSVHIKKILINIPSLVSLNKEIKYTAFMARKQTKPSRGLGKYLGHLHKNFDPKVLANLITLEKYLTIGKDSEALIIIDQMPHNDHITQLRHLVLQRQKLMSFIVAAKEDIAQLSLKIEAKQLQN